MMIFNGCRPVDRWKLTVDKGEALTLEALELPAAWCIVFERLKKHCRCDDWMTFPVMCPDGTRLTLISGASVELPSGEYQAILIDETCNPVAASKGDVAICAETH